MNTPQPKDFESFLYVSQVLQAEGIKVGAEHLRRIMPRNMGSLYWQINDCWPVASWSGIDYFGRWKALHYYARRFYNDLLISPHEADGKINIHLVSDQPEIGFRSVKTIPYGFFGSHGVGDEYGCNGRRLAEQNLSVLSQELILLRVKTRRKYFFNAICWLLGRSFQAVAISSPCRKTSL